MNEHIIYITSNEQDSEFWLDEELLNLNKQLDTNILIIADLGLWNGRRSGYKIIGSNLSNILSVSCGDLFKVYFDSESGDIKAEDVHHDGTNYYTFRQIRKGKDIDVLLEKIYDGNFTDEDVNKYTKSLGSHVCKIYGWKKEKSCKKNAA